MRIKSLEELARDMVGDGGSPNVFFVCTFEGKRKSRGVIMITRDFQYAYECWSKLSRRNHESTLEDRKWGVICSVEPEVEGGKKLIIIDDNQAFLKAHPQPPNW